MMIRQLSPFFTVCRHRFANLSKLCSSGRLTTKLISHSWWTATERKLDGVSVCVFTCKIIKWSFVRTCTSLPLSPLATEVQWDMPRTFLKNYGSVSIPGVHPVEAALEDGLHHSSMANGGSSPDQSDSSWDETSGARVSRFNSTKPRGRKLDSGHSWFVNKVQ